MSQPPSSRDPCDRLRSDCTGDSVVLPTTSPTSITTTVSASSTTTSTTTPSFSSSSPDLVPSSSDPSPASTSTLAQPTSVSHISSPSPDAGPIAGGVVGGVILLILILLGLILYLRARKKKRTPPSSEFMNSIRAGAAPVLRLDSGAEYTPALTEKGVEYSPTPVSRPYYPSPAMQAMEEMTVPSERPSFDKPLHPQRYSAQQQANDAFLSRHHPGTSIGSRRELWGSDTEVAQTTRGQSPVQTDPMLRFAPRFSLDDPSLPPTSYSPPSLHPLRRQPDP